MRNIEIRISEYVTDDIWQEPIKKKTISVGVTDLGTKVSDEILEKCYDELFVEAKDLIKKAKFRKYKEEKFG